MKCETNHTDLLRVFYCYTIFVIKCGKWSCIRCQQIPIMWPMSALSKCFVVSGRITEMDLLLVRVTELQCEVGGE